MLTRRTLLAAIGAAGGAFALPLPAAAVAADPVADEYHRLLLVHTRWVQQQWDAAIGAYRAADFRFAAVLGNAVLLTTDGYDAGLAGVDAATLRARTLATISRFAATNRLAGGSEWGRRLFWDSTFELYFVLAARLLWAELDATTRSNVEAIARGQAAYAYGLGTGNDPLSGSWTPNGSTGGYRGDTKLEEMGVYAQAIAPGLAWAPAGDAEADRWRERFVFWAANSSGLPAADRANPALLDGRAVSAWNVAHNLHDTFVVENHESVNPHYQAELWRTAGRAAAHFLAAGKPLPQVLTRQPNGRELWATLRLLASDAGEPVMPMVADRYHLYGRDVLPLAFLAQVQGDPHAARAEADLAARLMPYLQYAPENRLTKFSGEEKYEPEARAELAIAYLFHRWRATPVQPVTSTEFFTAAAGARFFGADAGLTAHQSVTGFAAAITKPGYVRFLWQPGHDNWFIDTRAPAFLPAQTTPPTRQWTAAYTAARDGVDATMTVLQTAAGWAGYATLPTGTVVYAGPGPSALTLFNLSMPGVPGLDGSRTFTGSGGAVTPAAGVGDGGTDELTFAARTARHVRFLGRTAAGEYGYSLFAFEALDATGTDRARGRTVTASSADPAYPAANAVDGDAGTRWAVAREERGRADSWLAVDLGATVQLAGVRLRWEVAYATSYLIQTSTDGTTWTTAATAPSTVTLGAWAGIDGRAGLVCHGATGPITASSAMVAIPPAALVEGYTGAGTDLAAARAAAAHRRAGGPAPERRRRVPHPAQPLRDRLERRGADPAAPRPAVPRAVRRPRRRRAGPDRLGARSDGCRATRPVHRDRQRTDRHPILRRRLAQRHDHGTGGRGRRRPPVRRVLVGAGTGARRRHPQLRQAGRRAGHPYRRPGPRPLHVPHLTAARRHGRTVARRRRQPRYLLAARTERAHGRRPGLVPRHRHRVTDLDQRHPPHGPHRDLDRRRRLHDLQRTVIRTVRRGVGARMDGRRRGDHRGVRHCRVDVAPALLTEGNSMPQRRLKGLGVLSLAAVVAFGLSLIVVRHADAAATTLGGADPSVIVVNGRYVSAKSVDGGIAVRSATTLAGIATAPKHQVWRDTGNLGEVWAPEIVHQDGRYQIYFAAGRSGAHRMYHISSTSPDSNYSAATKVALPGDKWAIDGVPFTFQGQRWFVWSGWAGDTNVEQNLYIARMSSPTTTTGGRYVISQPRESWERVVGNPYINEAPEPILDPNGQLHIVYSANGSWSSRYCLADLRLRAGGNPTDVWDWYKSNGCLFGSYADDMMSGWDPTLQVDGPGHHTFVLERGDIAASPPSGRRFPTMFHAVAKGTPYAWSNRYWYTGTAVWWSNTTYRRANVPGATTDVGYSLKFFE
ncbi:family 43 glycosylhydrolase [Dactylosporangium sp. NBC_01737]|nr:family 43 glycosylhydrolase [Dactylosporangium sp. NBC_01737]